VDRQRNTLALVCSTDLRNWEIRSVILYDPDVRYVGFQYADWLFDGDDMIAVVRTAFGETTNCHNANYLTFHRIENFRDLRMPFAPAVLDKLLLTDQANDRVLQFSVTPRGLTAYDGVFADATHLDSPRSMARIDNTIFVAQAGNPVGIVRFDMKGVTTQVDSRYTLNSQRKVGRAFLPDPEALESQPGMADLPRLPE
jgi:hypothetical protein